MKILFIHCNIETYVLPHFVPGIASIAAVLKKAGHHTAFMSLQEEMEPEVFLEKVRGQEPDLVGFSTLTNQWSIIRRYTKLIKAGLNIPIIHGGIHVTVAPEASLACPEIDLICVGEGEYPVLELIGRLEKRQSYDDIQNLWIKKADGQIIKNPLRPLIAELDTLPFVEREMFDYRRMLQENPMYATIFMVGRGCPFKCKYCVNHVLQKRYQGLGKYVRVRSVENVLEEMRLLKEGYGIKEILIYDDTFTCDHQWLRQFCERFKKEINIPFTVNVRVDTVNESVLKMMQAAGCERIIAGVESGSERIRSEILGRKMSNEKIINIYKKADEMGMKTTAYFMIGLPSETPEEARASIDLCNIIRPNYSQCSIFYPYPGTELYALCEQKGYLTPEGVESTNFFKIHQLLNLPTLSQTEIEHYFNDFWRQGNKIRSQKESKGVVDFLVDFDKARVRAQAGNVLFAEMAVHGEMRLVLFAHPEAKISYDFELPENAGLAFGITLSPQVWSSEKGIGVLFKITLNDNDEEKVIFSQYIDPKNNPLDQKWHDINIALKAYGSGSKTINFITTTRGRPGYYCWANWSRPYIYINTGREQAGDRA